MATPKKPKDKSGKSTETGDTVSGSPETDLSPDATGAHDGADTAPAGGFGEDPGLAADAPSDPDTLIPDHGAPEPDSDTLPASDADTVGHEPDGIASEDTLAASDPVGDAPESGVSDDTLAVPRDGGEPFGDATAGDTPDTDADSIRASDTAETPPPPAVVERETVVRKGGFLPMVLGGVVAALLGFLAAPSLQNALPFLAPAPNPFEDEARGSIAQQSEALGSLESRVETIATDLEGIDLSAVEGSVGDLSSRIDGLDGRIADLSDQIAGFDSRLTALEKEPLANAVSPEAIAAYERELEDLRSAVDAQRAEIETMAADAVAAEQSASQQAELAQARAALAQMTAALQNGAPFAMEVTTLQANGLDVPDPLSSVASDGVPTLTALAADFPDLAREALAEARVGASETEPRGLGNFLQRQLGARSVTPRDGSDPDAVLSRAEAALKAGDLSMALNELNTLPEPAQAVMADWMARAERRQAAMGAAESVAQELNQE